MPSAEIGRETRAQILRTAMDTASVKGLSGLSIGDLATQLGMSKSGLFRHFGAKEQLQLATVDAALGVFEREVAMPAMAASPGLDRLRALMQRMGGIYGSATCSRVAASSPRRPQTSTRSPDLSATGSPVSGGQRSTRSRPKSKPRKASLSFATTLMLGSWRSSFTPTRWRPTGLGCCWTTMGRATGLAPRSMRPWLGPRPPGKGMNREVHQPHPARRTSPGPRCRRRRLRRGAA